jgi:hypothetical protein
MTSLYASVWRDAPDTNARIKHFITAWDVNIFARAFRLAMQCILVFALMFQSEPANKNRTEQSERGVEHENHACFHANSGRSLITSAPLQRDVRGWRGCDLGSQRRLFGQTARTRRRQILAGLGWIESMAFRRAKAKTKAKIQRDCRN